MKSPVAIFRNLVGPTAVMAAGTMGAGAASSLILAGAWFGYSLLWVIPLMLPLFVISVDSASRIGLLNPDKGMFRLISERIHPGIGWLILAINAPVHLLIAMGQMSVITSALLSLAGLHPPTGAEQDTAYQDTYRVLEIVLSLGMGALLAWLLTSGGYQRMQSWMTALMVLMFFTFLIVAISGLREILAIAQGFVPTIPASVMDPMSGETRMATSSIIAIIGSALAPAALLGIPYMSAESSTGNPDLASETRKSVINLGVIFGCYSAFVIIAGGYALFPLSNHAGIDTVHEAGQVLVHAFPAAIDFLGPLVFTAGLLVAALTTFVVVVQVMCYFCLDMLGRDWHDRKENPGFKRAMLVWVLLPALLAPFWSFPAMLKVVLLMGFNAIVIPLVLVIVIYLVNQKTLMKNGLAGPGRNLILGVTLLLALWLTVEKLPDYFRLLGL